MLATDNYPTEGTVMKLLAVLLCLLTLATSAVASDSRITFATLNWAPYAAESLPSHGFTSAILTEACKRAGYTAEFHFMPWTRAMEEVRIGEYDALYNAYCSAERAKTYAMSVPYYQTKLMLATTIDKDITYDGTTESLHPYRIGVVRGYVNTEAIDSDTQLKKDEAENDLMNLKKLLNGRVDIIAIDEFQALYLLKHNPTIQKSNQQLRFLKPVLEKKPIHVMFSRNTPNWEEKLRRFNQGLEQIIDDGTLNRLMIQYGIAVQYNEN